MNREQLGELILESQESLYHVAKTLLRSDADCEDAISETIVKAFSNVHTMREDRYAKTWLIRILMNECYALMRRDRRIVSMETYPREEKTGQREDYSELYEAISRLPYEIRLCVILYYLEGYSVKEVAELMEVTESTVKNRLMRVRKRLKRELEPEVAEK